MQRLFNDEDDLPSPGVWKYNPDRPINEQIIFHGTPTKVGFDHVQLGSEKHVSTQTIMEYPADSLDDLTLNKVMGGIWGPRDDGNQCDFPFLVSVSIVSADLSHLFHGKTNAMMVQDKRGSSAGFKMEKQIEMAWAATETDRGERFVRVIPTILTISKNRNTASENTARIRRLWESQGFIVNKERGIVGPLFMMSLPFGLYATKRNISWLQRDRIMPTQSAVRMLPLQGDFSGYGRPVTMLLGRKGQIVPIDIFNPEAPNSNILISASTGHGKSYLMNRILTDQQDTGTIIRVFDLGRSYEKLTQIKKGNFIHFGKDSRVCVNPFTTVRDINEEIEILSLIISQMVWSSTRDKPTETQMTIIKTATRYVWDTLGNDGQVNHVRKALLDFDSVLKHQEVEFKHGTEEIRRQASEIAFNLGDFTGSGPYARWFNGRATLDISRDRFVVLELEELFAMKELFKVVVLQIVNYVTQNLYLSTRDEPRLIVFDEAWKWFKEGSFLGEVVENGYRLARKYYGGFITIFQSMTDLEDFGNSGQVLKTNSSFKFYLWAKGGYDLINKKKHIDVDPFMLEVFNSVRTEKGRYSEILVETPNNMGVARLPGDTFTHLVFTSDPRENAAIRRHAKEKGLTQIEAIMDLTNSKAA
jgi:conjugal transfer ATP-binding protein TraC